MEKAVQNRNVKIEHEMDKETQVLNVTIHPHPQRAGEEIVRLLAHMYELEHRLLVNKRKDLAGKLNSS